MQERTPAEKVAELDCEGYCKACKKLVSIKTGNPIPSCCGKLMEVID
jgi:hypothetical protein